MLAFAALTVIALLFLAYEAKAAPLVPDPPLQGRFDLSQGDRDCGRPAVFVSSHGQPTATERREHPLGR